MNPSFIFSPFCFLLNSDSVEDLRACRAIIPPFRHSSLCGRLPVRSAGRRAILFWINQADGGIMRSLQVPLARA
jgi:hypothetical protein